jgi:HEAT repeat protein
VPHSLLPRATDSREFLLNYHVTPVKPGRYAVKGIFQSPYVQRGIRIESNTVAITVVETRAERVRLRIANLLRHVDADPARTATLLGFTGNPEAIPSVVDLLYSASDHVTAAAVDALLFFDPAAVRQSLLDALNRRGPRDRMIYFLVVMLRTPLALTQAPLLNALRSADSEARAAAVEGLRLSNRASDPKLFAPLAAVLRDPVSQVRHRAASAVGQYVNQHALDALRPVVADPDPDVSEQATIAVGWVADASPRESKTRADAVELLRALAASSRRGTSEQAKYWLSRVGAR